MTGAGFGGCTVLLVKREAIADLEQCIGQHYPQRFKLEPSIFVLTHNLEAGPIPGT